MSFVLGRLRLRRQPLTHSSTSESWNSTADQSCARAILCTHASGRPCLSPRRGAGPLARRSPTVRLSSHKPLIHRLKVDFNPLKSTNVACECERHAKSGTGQGQCFLRRQRAQAFDGALGLDVQGMQTVSGTSLSGGAIVASGLGAAVVPSRGLRHRYRRKHPKLTGSTLKCRKWSHLRVREILAHERQASHGLHARPGAAVATPACAFEARWRTRERRGSLVALGCELSQTVAAYARGNLAVLGFSRESTPRISSCRS
jgi:hypothetical protein